LDSGNKGWILPAKLKVALAKKIKEKIGDGEVENDERNFKEAFENMEKKRLQKITYEGMQRKSNSYQNRLHAHCCRHLVKNRRCSCHCKGNQKGDGK